MCALVIALTMLLAMTVLAPTTAAQDASVPPGAHAATSIPVRFAVAPTDAADAALTQWYQTSGDRRCDLTAVSDPNLASAPWSLKRPWPKPSARTITIKVQEWACNSGRPPTGRVPPPTVHYTPAAIYLVAQTIPNSRTWRENAVSGSHAFVDCQGAPPAVYTVQLDRRVRDRDLYDGGPFPPKRKTRPEER